MMFVGLVSHSYNCLKHHVWFMIFLCEIREQLKLDLPMLFLPSKVEWLTEFDSAVERA